MEETKTVDAVVENKEDEMGLTTQNQDEITIEEGTPGPKDAVLWKKAKKMAAKADHKDDSEYTMVIYNQLMAEKEAREDENSEEPPAQDEPTMDEKINATGTDVPTVERPKAESKLKAKVKDVQGLVHRECIDRAAIIFLAKTLLTPTDLEDFKTLYPSLF